jgi:hypothetical protein
METFRSRTGLAYDRVMIFPRGVFNKESLGLLKTHNFLMTINSTRPLNVKQVPNDVDRIRQITLDFENFPVVTRHGIPDLDNRQALTETKFWVRMRLFLDLPVFLYTHHGFFKNGSAAFNSLADFINTAQPDVVWTSLGNIATRLYLQRRTEAREMEVLAFSSNLVIRNTYPFAMKYVVRKKEDFVFPIQSVEVDGNEHDYAKEDGYITIVVTLEPNRERNIGISYHSNYNVDSFRFSDNALQAMTVRALSDFRDIYLSQLPYGDRIVVAFYSMGGVRIIFIGLSGFILSLVVLYVWHARKIRA